MAYFNRLFLEQKHNFCHYIIFQGGSIRYHTKKKKIKSRLIAQKSETEPSVSIGEDLGGENTVDNLVAAIKQGEKDLDKLKSSIDKIEVEKWPLKEVLNTMKKEKVHDKYKIAHQREFNEVWSKILILSQEIKHKKQMV